MTAKPTYEELEQSIQELDQAKSNCKLVEQTVSYNTALLEAQLGGVYCENCNIARAVTADSTDLLGVRPWATDPSLAERLWEASIALTGVSIPH